MWRDRRRGRAGRATLARFRHRVVLVDAGGFRNAAAVYTTTSCDGMPPTEFLAAGWAEPGYGTQLIDGCVSASAPLRRRRLGRARCRAGRWAQLTTQWVLSPAAWWTFCRRCGSPDDGATTSRTARTPRLEAAISAIAVLASSALAAHHVPVAPAQPDVTLVPAGRGAAQRRAVGEIGSLRHHRGHRGPAGRGGHRR